MQQYAITPYDGKQPYIFISYAHKDSEMVYPILEELNRRGYRVWYDDGIRPGNEWPEDVAQHLDGAYLVISMISPRYIVSDNCLRELHFAFSKGKAFLAVFLEETALSLGLEMQLSAKLCVMKHNYSSEEPFYKKLCSCPDMTECHETNVSETIREQRNRRSAVQAIQPEKSAADSDGKKRVLPGIAAVIIALLLTVSVWVLYPMLTENEAAQTVQPSVEPIEDMVEEEMPVVMGNARNLMHYQGMDGDDNILIWITGFFEDGDVSPEQWKVTLKGHLIVPEELAGYPVYATERQAFEGYTKIQKITLPSTLGEIAMLTFSGCSSLEEIEILGDTGNTLTINAPAFAGCTALRKVSLPGRVTSISNNAFSGCSALKEVILPETMQSIGAYAFKESGLEEIKLPDAVASMGENVFESCEGLRDVVLPKSLKTIAYGTFYDCTALESVWIPASVAVIEEDAFFNCSSLCDIYYEGTEQQWNVLMSEIDFSYPEGSVLRNNMALQKAEIHFNS